MGSEMTAKAGTSAPAPTAAADAERASPGAPAGRFAPSPSGDFHLGNLRTAILAWFSARSTGRRFIMRIEDLDRVKPGAAERQLEDMAALGIEWDEPIIHQSERLSLYEEAARRLADADLVDLVYECYCTRREILDAPSAPHAPPGAYPGTCRDLTEAERERGRAKVRELNREPALRLRAGVAEWSVVDAIAGRTTGTVDDLVLRRGDGVWAYNLVSVVDDAAFGVDQVVRADDLLSSAPRQAYLTQLLERVWPELWRLDVDGGAAGRGAGRNAARASAGADTGSALIAPWPPAPWPHVQYIHVPLALNTTGQRLAKRDGAVTLHDRLAAGESVEDVVGRIGASLGVTGARTAQDIAAALPADPRHLPHEPWIVDLP